MHKNLLLDDGGPALRPCYQLQASGMGNDGKSFSAMSGKIFLYPATAQSYMDAFANNCYNKNKPRYAVAGTLVVTIVTMELHDG